MLGECSKSCGGGTLTQTRQVKVESQHGGEECTGADTLEVSCNVDECPGNKKLVESMMSNFTQNPTHILHIFTQIFHVCKVSSMEVDLLETGVKRCPDGLEIESITECKEACAYLKIPLSSNKFKEGKPCYKGGSHVCNQNGAFGRNAKLICKKPGNFKLTIV